MEFTLEIHLGNDAMQTADDIADRLILVAAQVRSYGLEAQTKKISDANGNSVGFWSLDGEEPDEENE